MTPEASVFRTVKQGRWLDMPAWVPPGEADACCLKDLHAPDNKLSVFVVPPGEFEVWKPRLVAALAACRESLDHLEFAVIPAARVLQFVAAEKTLASTGDSGVNELHWDLIEVTANKAAAFAGEIAEACRHGSLERVLKGNVLANLEASLEAGVLEKGKVRPGVLKEIRV